MKSCKAIVVGLAAVAALLLSNVTAHAGQQGFAFDYPAGATVTGFKLYCGTATKTYNAAPAATVAGNVRAITATFPAGRQFCSLAAYDAAGDSPFSNEVTFIEAPGNLRLVVQCQLDMASGLYRCTVQKVTQT